MPEDFSSDDSLGEYESYSSKKKKKSFREDMEDDGIIQSQTKSLEVLEQELLSHKQAFLETFSEDESNTYFKKLKDLRSKVNKARRLAKNG